MSTRGREAKVKQRCFDDDKKKKWKIEAIQKKRMAAEKQQRRGCFYPEESVVDLLRHTPGINLFEPNKREQLNSL